MTGNRWSCVRRWALVVMLALVPLMMGHHPSFPAPLEFVPGDGATDQEDWVFVVTPGFITGERSDELVCKEAFGAEGRLYAAALGTDHYAMATDDGVAVTFDGCNRDRLHTLEGWAVDLAGYGDDRLAVISGESEHDRVFWSTDGGDSLDNSIQFDDQYQLTALEWLDSDRVVVSGFENTFDEPGLGWMFIIDVTADQIVEQTELNDELRYPFVLAAGDGTIAAAARSDGFESTSRLVWGPADAPDTHWETIDAWPADADVSGDTVWAGPLYDGWDDDWTGLAVGDAEGNLEEDERLADHDVMTVTEDGDGLWIGSSGFAEAYELWRMDDGYDPQPFYRLAYLEGPRSDCPDDSDVAQICPEYWDLVEPEIPRRSLDGGDDDDEDNDTDRDDGPDRDRTPSNGDDDLPGWYDDVMGGDDDESDRQDDDAAQTACAQAAGSPPMTALLIMALMAMLALYRAAITAHRRDRRSRGFQ